MRIDESNERQAEFWKTAGPTWVRSRARFDDQAGAHGLAAIAALAPRAGERILDVGCGAGSTAIELAARVGPDGSVLGLDISPPMIEGARELAGATATTNVTFEVADVMAYDFTADADGVFSRFGVMFFSDATAGFSALRGALRAGGRLAFTCWRSAAENPWIGESFATVARYVELPFGQDVTAPGPLSLADPDRVHTVLTGAGFTDVEVTPHDALAMLGSDPADAVEFLSDLMPMIAALRADDPDAADRLDGDLMEMVAQWSTDAGVGAPSATWIVTATAP